MKVKNIKCSLFFQRIEAPRSKIDKLESSNLSKYFIVPFNPQPIPNDAPPVLPRITATSINGDYDLRMSQINVQLTRKKSADLDEEFDNILEEMKSILEEVYNSIFNIYEEKLLYFGINCLVDIDDDTPIQTLQNKYLKNINDNIIEMNLRYSTVEKNKYYKNIVLSNITEYQMQIPLTKEQQQTIVIDTLSTSQFNEVKKMIQMNVDINDKYSFNQDCNYRTTNDEIKNIINEIKSTLKTKISDVLE